MTLARVRQLSAVARQRREARYPRFRHLPPGMIPEDAELRAAFRASTWEGFECTGHTTVWRGPYEPRYVVFWFRNQWGHQQRESVTIRHHARGMLTVRAVRAIDAFAKASR